MLENKKKDTLNNPRMEIQKIETKLRVLRGDLIVTGSLATILGGGEAIVLHSLEQHEPGYLKYLATELPKELWKFLKQLTENPSQIDLNNIKPEMIFDLANITVACGAILMAYTAISNLREIIKEKSKSKKLTSLNNNEKKNE